MLLYVVYYNQISAYKGATYDYVLRDISQEQVYEIAQKNFVSESFAVRILGAELCVAGDGNTKDVDIYLCDSWSGIDITYFAGNRIVSGKILDIENGIILDILTARALRVGVGDTVTFCVGNNENTLTYTIMMLIEPVETSLYGTALAIYSDYFTSIWLKNFENDVEYSKMFLQSYDFVEASDYLINEFRSVYMTSSTDEDNIFYNQKINVSRMQQISDIEYDMQFTPEMYIIISCLAALVYCLFVFRETDKKRDYLSKNFAIFHVLGSGKGIVLFYFIFENLIMQIPALLIAAVLSKLIIYDLFITNYYLPWSILGGVMIIGIVITIFSAVFISGFIYRAFKKQSLSQLLAKE